jgi:hypothetical protein
VLLRCSAMARSAHHRLYYSRTGATGPGVCVEAQLLDFVSSLMTVVRQNHEFLVDGGKSAKRPKDGAWWTDWVEEPDGHRRRASHPGGVVGTVEVFQGLESQLLKVRMPTQKGGDLRIGGLSREFHRATIVA